jgi:UDP-hydrolysing UDP-N-acetyl-D-glucosamine 2-epimerase
MKNVCIVVASRANYGRVRSVIHAVNNHKDLNLQLIVSGSAVLERFGNVSKIIQNEGIRIDKEFYHMVEGGNSISQALSTGLGLIELSHAFDELKPDIVLTVADRFETMATAIAASYQNIPLGHIQGGEVSGNIDELVRHSITKLSHYHFPSTTFSMERIKRMGEEENRIVLTGCPSIDLLKYQDLNIDALELSTSGVGGYYDFKSKYILFIYHPETDNKLSNRIQVTQLLEILKLFSHHKIVLWPNIDSGTDEVSRGIRQFREKGLAEGFTFYKNFEPKNYNIILNNAEVCIGNSSSFIRECSYLGTPSVIVGKRQTSREHNVNAIFVDDINKEIITRTIEKQLEHGKYPQSRLFGDGEAASRIVEFISSTTLNIHKKMSY